MGVESKGMERMGKEWERWERNGIFLRTEKEWDFFLKKRKE